MYRFYLCPPGVIGLDDLPERWGLLYAEGRVVRDVLRPLGNGWPSFGTPFGEWGRFQHEVDAHAERDLLFSIARRRSLSRSDERYEKRVQEEVRKVGRLARENAELAEKVKKLELDLYLAGRGLSTEPKSPADLKAAIRRRLPRVTNV
ncbi:hypothetical protein [Burkholderia sp. LMG 13014]|uniref:hypothetical protein n=1 Tax=Burkholderia sp. LMG 13014 TaxID=2709306 RepID=UPI001963138E|nr:hypothetical protein [Burkholderia sp. LMG 13014]